MRIITSVAASLTLAVLCFLPVNATADTTPRFIVFTYAGNPSTTLTVNWQTKSELSWAPAIHSDTSPRDGGLASTSASLVHGTTSQIKGLKDRYIHRVQLTNLEPNTTYYLSIGNEQGKPLEGSPEYKIKTIPDDETPLRFVTGGDMGTSDDVRILLKHSAEQDPNFAVVGGDVAYANGDIKNINLWDKWLKFYTEEMITADGYTIPLVLAIGNHETQGMFDKTFKASPLFTGLFGQDMEKNYFSRRFGKNLALLILDSGHTASHESQASWIHEELKKFKDVPYTAAVYHVPLYPSHRDFMGKHSDLGRKHWAPVFDEMELTVAFENHDHTYKRTHLLKDNKITKDGSGTLYLGDGCWGRSARAITYGGRWYLKEAASVQHFWSVDVAASGMVYRAINIDNQVFDIYPQNLPDADEANMLRADQESVYELPPACVETTPYTAKDDEWTGGPTTIRIINTFEYSMSYTIRPRVKTKYIKAEGFSKEIYQLDPGDSKEHPITFKPSSNKSLELNRAKLRFSVSAKLKQPDNKTVQLQSSFGIPVNSEK